VAQGERKINSARFGARLSVGRCLSVSGDVQSHTAILETDGCAWVIAHTHRIDLPLALEQLPASCDQLFPAFPTFKARVLLSNM
jgi:hypothetical protein